MERTAFSEAHDLGSYDAALEIIASAGLGAILLPTRKSARSNEHYINMAVVGAEPGERFPIDSETRVHCIFPIKPMTDYVGELTTCDLSKPWWAAPLFFSAVASVLAPGYSELVKRDPPGRAHWGYQVRAAFDQRFREIWLDGEHEPAPLQPGIALRGELIRALSCPVLPWPEVGS